VGSCVLYSSGSAQRQVVDCCKHGTETSVSRKANNLLTS